MLRFILLNYFKPITVLNKKIKKKTSVASEILGQQQAPAMQKSFTQSIQWRTYVKRSSTTAKSLP